MVQLDRRVLVAVLATLVIGFLLGAFTNVVGDVVGYLVRPRPPIITDLWGWFAR